jgi:hypothetical protein
MTIPARVLWANSIRNAFVADWQSNSDLSSISLRQGDTVGIELHWVEQSVGNPMKEVVWPTAANITLALGRLDSPPTSGGYRLSYGGQTTPAIAFNAEAISIQAALNSLSSIASEGGVSVVKTSTTWRAVWNVPGPVSSTITVAENALAPTSSLGIAVARTGATGVAHIVQVHIKQSPVAVCTTWENTPAPTSTLTQTHAPAYSGDNRTWRLVITPEPKGGTLRLSYVINGVTYYTPPISVTTLSANTIQEVLPDVAVIQVSDFEFDLSQVQTTPNPTVNISTMSADSSGLIGFSSKFGLLSLNSLDVELLLGGAASATVVCEVEVEMDGKRQTLVQSNAVIFNDLIDTDSYTLVQWPDVVPADSVVRYDTPQSLTTAQKAQARTNIGAIDSALLDAYGERDDELESRVADLETKSLTSDQKAAAAGAASPSATNVFATANELVAKADAVHTHTIAQITDLDTELAAKAAVGHAHTIGEVAGLLGELSSLDSAKSDIDHTHTIGQVDGLTEQLNQIEIDLSNLDGGALTDDQKQAIEQADTPSAGNTFITQSAMAAFVSAEAIPVNLPVAFTTVIGNYTDVTYPYEITLTINGVDYKIPARLA